MAAILSQPQCVNHLIVVGGILAVTLWASLHVIAEVNQMHF